MADEIRRSRARSSFMVSSLSFAKLSISRKLPGSTKETQLNRSQPIVPGLWISASGEATIDPSIKDTLLDLATILEEPTGLPVDIEHVVAAIVLAARNKEIHANAILSAADSDLIETLTPHIKSVFAIYGGVLNKDDSVQDE